MLRFVFFLLLFTKGQSGKRFQALPRPPPTPTPRRLPLAACPTSPKENGGNGHGRPPLPSAPTSPTSKRPLPAASADQGCGLSRLFRAAAASTLTQRPAESPSFRGGAGSGFPAKRPHHHHHRHHQKNEPHAASPRPRKRAARGGCCCCCCRCRQKRSWRHRLDLLRFRRSPRRPTAGVT